MSVKVELAKLLADARDVLGKVEGAARSELNRVEDALRAAESAVVSAHLPDDVKPASRPAKKAE